MTVIDNGYQPPLKKLTQVKLLFGIPIAAWLLLLFSEPMLHRIESPTTEHIGDILATVVFYSVQLLFVWLVLATLVSSWRILETNSWRNAAAFLALQAFAIFVTDALGWSVPSLTPLASFWAALITAVLVFAAVSIINVTVAVPVDADDALGKAGTGSTPADAATLKDGTGIGMAVVLSTVIASTAFLQPRTGIAFVPWGVIVGTLAGIAWFGGDKMTLSLLHFLDPAGAVTLYHLIKAREAVRRARRRRDVQLTHAELIRERDEIEWGSLRLSAAERIRRALRRVAEQNLEATVTEIEAIDDQPPAIRAEKLRKALGHIDTLGPDDPILLPAPSAASLSIGERLSARVGLEDDQIAIAREEGMISAGQEHLWTPAVQLRIKSSLEDVQEDRMRGDYGIAVPRNFVSYFQKNDYLLRRLVPILAADNPPVSRITGDPSNLSEVRFPTAAAWHSAVVKKGTDGTYIVFAVTVVPDTKPAA
jgi:hypothetical protein